MKLNYLLMLSAASLFATVPAHASSTSSGVVKLEVPVQTIITPIAADALDFGMHPMAYFEEPRSISTQEDIFSNVTATSESLCLTASFPKYGSTEELPYLSPESSDSTKFNTPIYLSKVDYETCGTAPSTYSLIDSGSSSKSVTLSPTAGITESACLGTGGSPGQLNITTLPVSSDSTPLLGGTYTSTINLSVSEGHC